MNTETHISELTNVSNVSNVTTTNDVGAVEWSPVHVQATGKTSVEKKLSVIQAGVSFAAAAYLSGQKGKVGAAVRDTMTSNGERMIAKQVFSGSYAGLAQSICAILGENLTLTCRRDYESLKFHYTARLGNLKNDGYSASGKPSAARTGLMQVLSLLNECEAHAKAEMAQRAAAKAAAAV